MEPFTLGRVYIYVHRQHFPFTSLDGSPGTPTAGNIPRFDPPQPGSFFLELLKRFLRCCEDVRVFVIYCL